MQVPGGTVAAAYFTLASASAPTGPSRKLATLAEDELELSERDLWEDDAGDLSLPITVRFGHNIVCCCHQMHELVSHLQKQASSAVHIL